MKTCTSCKTEINEKATKCPHCQAFQKWTRNPQYLSLVFLLPIILMPLWMTNLTDSYLPNNNFEEMKHLLTVEENAVVKKDNNRILLTYKITNDSDVRWKDLKYELRGANSDGEIIYSNSESEYSWVINKGESAFVSIEIAKINEVEKYTFLIKELSSRKY